ncbi:MAG: bifunctional glycosyltransferase/class I SAM-dependent methyltransferase [Opitutaceae bacterium]|nr:bifunctional glycosyltransferase/class I SAM-dependent methyltransferase [Opitutaceae bacterium]
MPQNKKPRVLIFIVAYYAEATILKVLERIPALDDYEVEVLIIDDCSGDQTFAHSEKLRRSGQYRHPLTVLANPVNQGYGGNQKIGYHYAIERGFDIVALLHGDGQYAPEMLPELLAPIARDEADVVHGSRMLRPSGALRGGMPFYKFIGNKLLTGYQNRVLHSQLSEFHTGYKIYSTAILRRIPFELNSNVFHFDTEIIIQLLRARSRIVEVPIPTHYGEEICRVNGLRYALDVVNASTVAWLQNYGLVYRRNFDVESVTPDNKHYLAKLDFFSTHSEAVKAVPAGAVVMDIGCGPGHLSAALRAQGCRMIGVDQFAPADPAAFDEFYVADLNGAPFPRPLHDVQAVLLLDIIEHLVSPEKFCQQLRAATQSNLDVRIVISTGNIGFFVTRLMLFFGQFNYNKRGILDLTHTRLFTFSSLRRLLNEAGFVVEKEIGIPAPAPLVVRSPFWRSVAMKVQSVLIKLCRGLFAYQMFMVVKPLPTLETLLDTTHRHSEAKSNVLA